MELSKLFGKKLKEIRENRGLTQQELAELCDMQTNSIGMIEIGQRAASFATVELLAQKLNVKYHELFDDSMIGIKETQNGLISSLYEEIKDFDNAMLKCLIGNAKTLKEVLGKK